MKKTGERERDSPSSADMMLLVTCFCFIHEYFTGGKKPLLITFQLCHLCMQLKRANANILS